MKKKYLVTVDGDRYIWQKISDNSNITPKEPSLIEVIKKLPKIFIHMGADRWLAMLAVLGETCLIAGLSCYMFQNIAIIAAFVALVFTVVLGPLSRWIGNLNNKLCSFLIIYPVCMICYIVFYDRASQIKLLSSDNIGNTLTAVSLIITIVYELFKMFSNLSLEV